MILDKDRMLRPIPVGSHRRCRNWHCSQIDPFAVQDAAGLSCGLAKLQAATKFLRHLEERRGRYDGSTWLIAAVSLLGSHAVCTWFAYNPEGRIPPVLALRTRMPQEPQQLDLPQYTRRVGDVVEHVVDLLDRHLLARLVVDRRADDAVGALADDLLDGVPVSLAVLREELRQVAVSRPRVPSTDLMLIFVLHLLRACRWSAQGLQAAMRVDWGHTGCVAHVFDLHLGLVHRFGLSGRPRTASARSWGDGTPAGTVDGQGRHRMQANLATRE